MREGRGMLGRDVPPGKLTSFPLAVKAEEGETVVVGWQEWSDKATQEAGMKRRCRTRGWRACTMRRSTESG